MLTIAFYRGRRHAKSWFIAWWQRSDFSHCEVVLRRVGDVYECAGAKLFEGVRVTTLELSNDDWEAWEIPADPVVAHAWLERHEGDLYDLLGLLGFVFRRIKGLLGAWWCSEACAGMANIPDPWRWDVALLRAHCMAVGRPVPL